MKTASFTFRYGWLRSVATCSFPFNPTLQASEPAIHIGHLDAQRVNTPGQRPDIRTLRCDLTPQQPANRNHYGNGRPVCFHHALPPSSSLAPAGSFAAGSRFRPCRPKPAPIATALALAHPHVVRVRLSSLATGMVGWRAQAFPDADRPLPKAISTPSMLRTSVSTRSRRPPPSRGIDPRVHVVDSGIHA